MVDIVVGLFGGIAASLMAALVFAFDDAVPFPLSIVLARLLGGEAAEYYSLGLVGTFVYGLPAGAAYASVFSRVPLFAVVSIPGAVVYGTVWGVALTVPFAVLVGDRQPDGYGRYLLAAHLLYGFTLAGFVLLGPTDPTATAGPVGGY